MISNYLSELEKDVVKMRYQMGAILLIHINEHQGEKLTRICSSIHVRIYRDDDNVVALFLRTP